MLFPGAVRPRRSSHQSDEPEDDGVHPIQLRRECCSRVCKRGGSSTGTGTSSAKRKACIFSVIALLLGGIWTINLFVFVFHKSTPWNGINLDDPNNADLFARAKPIPTRFVHLDLKGMPPKEDFVEKLIRQLPGYGASGVLLEWEDMFPYSPEILTAGSKKVYSFDYVRKILHAAEDVGLQVIPLVRAAAWLSNSTGSEPAPNVALRFRRLGILSSC